MPPPLLLAPFGHFLSLAASKQAALSAAGSVDAYTASSAALAYVLARLAWNRVPEWIKEDVAVRNLLPTREEPGSSTRQNVAMELSNLTSVIEKLHALLVSGSEKLSSSESEPVPFLHASVLAYVQLATQLHKLYPEDRNQWYCNAGEFVSKGYIDRNSKRENNRLDTASLKEYLDFAIWAYATDTKVLQEWLGTEFYILQYNTLISGVVRPGHVGHYVAVSEARKLVVIGVRGTSTLEDLLTDCCGRAVSYSGCKDYTNRHYDEAHHSRVEVCAAQPNRVQTDEEGEIEVVSGHEQIWVEDQHDDNGQYSIRCHEGILICATRLANEIQATIEKLVIDDGYSLLLCGHSLGAGVASLVAIILRSRLPALVDGQKTTMIKVIAFAPPPVLDHDSAIAASSYMTSIVNNSDIIPRSSLSNLAVFLEFLRSVSVRLEERGLAPTSPSAVAALIRKLTSVAIDENELLMTLDEVRSAIHEAHSRIELRDPDHLYIPGQVLIMFERWGSAVDLKNDSNASIREPWQFVVTDGSAAVLRFFEFDAFRMVTDHATASYFSSMEYFHNAQHVNGTNGEGQENALNIS